MSQPSPALPPRGERFTDASARAVWAAIVALPAALQHQILEALRNLLACLDGTSTHATRVRHAVVCLREAHDLLGHSPSIKEYRELHAARGTELSWPADGSIRTWIGGSWNDCLKEARLEAVADGDVVVAQLGPAFTAEEITTALQECARELKDVPTISQYYAWARRPDVKARPGRRPQSQSPFDRTFGGYVEALTAAGLTSGIAGVTPKRSTVVRVGGYFASEADVSKALQEVAAKLGRPPRTKEYALAREEIIAVSIDAGTPRTLPSVSTIQKKFGTWDDALAAAGLQRLGGRATQSHPGDRGRKGPLIPDAEALAVLREAYAQVGDPFTVAAFQAWRKEQQQRDKLERRFRRLATYDLYRSRWGTWDDAVRKALESQDDDGDAVVS